MSNRSVVATLLLLALTVSTAQGSGPTIFKMPIENTEVVNFCGFPMEIFTTGTAVVHLFLDDSGNFQRVLITAPQTKLTFTNLITGESVWTPSVNMVQQTQVDDDSRTATLRGLFWRLVVPGDGLVTADVGRIDFLLTLNEDGTISEELVFSAGQQEGQFLSQLCAVLS